MRKKTEQQKAAEKLLMTAKWLPCDLDGCKFWFIAGCDFKGLEPLIALRKHFKKLFAKEIT
jgi:hypothetical protein